VHPSPSAGELIGQVAGAVGREIGQSDQFATWRVALPGEGVLSGDAARSEDSDLQWLHGAILPVESA
jgi:hypothetical protein